MVRNDMTMFRKVFLIISLFFLLKVDNLHAAENDYEICDSPRCIQFSQVLNNSIDRSVDPCNNFYEFACNGWIQNDSNRNGRSSEWQTTVLNNTIDILKVPLQPEDSESLKKAKQIFKECAGRLDDTGLQNLKIFLNRLGGWPIVIYPRNGWNRRKTIRWQNVAMHLDRYNLKAPFYSIGQAFQPANLQRSIVLSSPLTNYLEENESRLREVVDVMLADNPRRNLKTFNDSINQDVADIMEFVYKMKNLTEKAQAGKSINIKELQKIYNEANKNNSGSHMDITQINWLRVIQNAHPMYRINETEPLTMTGFEYFKNISQLLKETPERTVVNYVLWFFVHQVIRHTNEAMREVERYPFEGYDREMKCLVEPNLDDTIQHEYIKKYSSDLSRAYVRYIINGVRYELRRQIRKTSWMDAKTRELSGKWLDHMRLQIGGPAWYSDSAVDQYYKSINLSSSYFNNILQVLALEQFEKRKQIRLLLNVTKTDNNEWMSLSPMTVNAQYSSALNTLTIPIASIDGYTFHLDWPMAINYGMLGYTAAHEITHGMDSERQIYELSGSSDWPKQSMQAYINKTRCFVEQYNFEIPEAHNSSYKMDGEISLNENIADSGIFAAFRAYKSFMEVSRRPETRLVNLEEYTADQLFFIGFANQYCEQFPRDNFERVIKLSHPPSRYRVLGTVSNTEEFATAFNCPANSPMNRPKKCKLWD